MRLTATFLFALATASGCIVNRGLPPPEPVLRTVSGGTTAVTDFERVVDDSMRKANVSGLSVAIINDRKVIYTRQFGWKDKDAGTRLDDATVFAAASLSKTIFAYVVLLLGDEGLIDLDKPLQGYLPKPLPEYPNYADLGTDDRYRAITARMVLSHTSGLPNVRSETGEQLRIAFQPGSRFSYSGVGFQLLQFVVETVTKSDLETLAHDRVFLPFGMSHTSYVWRDRFANDVAAPHNEFEWASEPDRPSTADAAGSLITTAHDYARFLVGILTAEGRRREVVATMFTPTVRITSSRMFGVSRGPLSPENDAKHLAWALGWGTFETPAGRAVFHTGHKGGAQNYAIVFPARGLGIVLLSNSDNFESVAAEIVAAGVDDRESPFDWLGYEPFDPATRKAAPPRLVAIQVPGAILAAYVGEYQFAPDAVTHIKADGDRLYASDDGRSWDELLAQSETVFFFKGRTVTITFVKDASGKVTRMDVDTGGAKLSAQRIR